MRSHKSTESFTSSKPSISAMFSEADCGSGHFMLESYHHSWCCPPPPSFAILETVITEAISSLTLLILITIREEKALWEREHSPAAVSESKHDPVAHIERSDSEEASWAMSFIASSDNTFYLFTSDETFHLISALLWVSPGDRDALRRYFFIASWYSDTADDKHCITSDLDTVIVSQNIPGIRFAAVSCCCHKELSNVGPGTDPGLEFVRWCEIETWLSSDNLLYQASH